MLSVTNKQFMLSVVMLNAVLLGVVASNLVAWDFVKNGITIIEGFGFLTS